MWLGVAGAALAAWIDTPWLAVAAGALAAVAAAGDLPVIRPVRGRVLRCLTPLVGACAAMLIRGTIPAGGMLCVGIVSMAATIGSLTARGTTAADAATAALVVAAAAIAAMRGGPAVGLAAEAALVAGWLVAGMLVAAGQRWTAAHAAVQRRTAGVSLGRGPLPAGGPLRRILNGLAMASMLVAMAGWLLLAPEHAAAARDLAMAWFIALAVPAALLQDGDAVRAAMEPIVRSAASDRPHPRVAPFGPARAAAEVAWGHAAVIAWPGLVAMAVGLASPSGIWPAVAVVGGVSAAAVVVTLVAAGLFWWGASGETALAVTMAIAVVALALIGPWFFADSPLHAGRLHAGFLRVAPESRC